MANIRAELDRSNWTVNFHGSGTVKEANAALFAVWRKDDRIAAHMPVLTLSPDGARLNAPWKFLDEKQRLHFGGEKRKRTVDKLAEALNIAKDDEDGGDD